LWELSAMKTWDEMAVAVEEAYFKISGRVSETGIRDALHAVLADAPRIKVIRLEGMSLVGFEQEVPLGRYWLVPIPPEQP